MSIHITRAARSQLGADILLRLYERITGKSLDGIRYPSQLSGSMITREQIENTDYESLTDLILELRNVYSASGMRCLRSDAASRKSPVLNLIRQVARANGLGLVSDRKPSGYATDGRKQFVYWYTFESLDGDYDLPHIAPSHQPDQTPEPQVHTETESNLRNIEPSPPSSTKSNRNQKATNAKTEPAEEDIITGTIILPTEK